LKSLSTSQIRTKKPISCSTLNQTARRRARLPVSSSVSIRPSLAGGQTCLMRMSNELLRCRWQKIGNSSTPVLLREHSSSRSPPMRTFWRNADCRFGLRMNKRLYTADVNIQADTLFYTYECGREGEHAPSRATAEQPVNIKDISDLADKVSKA